MVSSINNQQDLTIFAIRRMGKSALIHHVFHQFKKTYDCLYVDLWGTTSLSGFINETANAVIQSSIFNKKSFSEKLTGFIRSIFSGSEQHLISDIFSSIDKPFYQSTRMIEIAKIDTTQYHQFITMHFQKGNKLISDTLVSHILSLCHGHTYYIQAICNLIYSQRTIPKTMDEFQKIYMDFIAEKQVIIKEGNAYRLYDVFLEHYLRYFG